MLAELLIGLFGHTPGQLADNTSASPMLEEFYEDGEPPLILY